ncbi:MAG: hypothetical protein M1838_004834, partial [Thelocarpon superellum]
MASSSPPPPRPRRSSSGHRPRMLSPLGRRSSAQSPPPPPPPIVQVDEAPSRRAPPRSPASDRAANPPPNGTRSGQGPRLRVPPQREESKEGMRKVAAEEISNLEGLFRIYSDPKRGREAVLRVFHVQNAQWATSFLLRKFGLDSRDNLVGTDFGQWVRKEQPAVRAGKPVLNGKTWKTQHDPWRSVSRSSFGIDYLKHYLSDPTGQSPTPADVDLKLMELNRYDEEDTPSYGHDIYVQRMGVCFQYKEEASNLPTDPSIKNPYTREEKGPGHRRMQSVDSMDNGSAILIFETSHSGSIQDTCIAARQEWESRWRRLPFYLAFESPDVTSDDGLAIECMKMISQDIFKSV